MKVYTSVMLLLLGSVFAIAAAGPISEASMKDIISDVLSQELPEAKYATYGRCLTRVHTVKIDFTGYEYIYKYRACKNDGILCYDAREILPEPCPEGFYGENCYEIEWKVQGRKFEHSICEDFGAPCQGPITYSRDGIKIYRLLKSNNYGVCYGPPIPIIQGRPPRPYVQKQENVKTANSISLCEEGEGCKEIPNVTVFKQDDADDDDCFCIRYGKHGHKVCGGECSGSD